VTRANEKCCLCGDSLREWKSAESGNALFVRCRNEECGDYAISFAAIRHLNKDTTSNITLLRSQAKHEKEQGRVLRIFMNDKHVLAFESKLPVELGL
jgi:hypothetical protein